MWQLVADHAPDLMMLAWHKLTHCLSDPSVPWQTRPPAILPDHLVDPPARWGRHPKRYPDLAEQNNQVRQLGLK